MINKEKSIKNILLIVIFITVIISGSAVSFYQYTLINDDVKNNIEMQNKYIYKAYDFLLKGLKEDLQEKSEHMLSITGIKKAFNEKDRDKLYSLVDDIYQRMSKQNKYLKIMTFRLNDGSTFLRVHKPNMFGDKLNKKRKIIVDAISTQKLQYGFEVGKLKMTYRIVTPIFYNKKLIGVVEVGVEPEYIIHSIDELLEIKTALLIKKEDRSIFLDKSKMQGLNEFLLVRGDELFKQNLKHIRLDQTTNKITHKGHEYLIDNMLDLKNHKGDVSAKILLAYDLKKFNEKLNNFFKKNILVTVMIILFLFILLNIGLNYFLRSIEKLYKDMIEKDSVMVQHSKMAVMGEMIDNILHQWKQPLSTISATTANIKIQNAMEKLTEDDLNESIAQINHSVEHLSQTTNDFRHFFKPDKLKHDFKINNTFEKVFKLLISQFKINNINIIKNIQNVNVHGFENELIHVFINILNNSKDELLKKEDGERLILINAAKNNDFLEIHIKDNAGGIPEDIIDKIFDSHFTTKHDKDGTGLGLYMSKKIIEDSFEGVIEIFNSEFNYEGKDYRGAEFKISLPIS